MNLHVAVSGWLLGSPSGANRRLENLLQHGAPLLAAGERITVLHGHDYVPFATLPGVQWQAVPIAAGPTLRRTWHERTRLPALLRELGATVLEHGFLPVPRVPVPVVATMHDLRAVDGMSRWPRWLARATVRHAAKHAAALVVPSEFTAMRVRSVAPRARCQVVANGVELPAPAPRDESAPAYLLHVGHIEPRKNLALLVRALAQLERGQRPQLHLVGRDAGALPELLQLAARLGVAESVRHCGALADGELARQFAAARAVVVPSRYEGFGLAALEGLAHGRPVLVADAGALPEVVASVGTVLPVDDVRAWALALAAITADDPADACQLAAARRKHAARFSWSASAAAMLALWRDSSQAFAAHE